MSAVEWAGMAILRQIGDAAKTKHAVWAHALTVHGHDRNLGAAWLRDHGVPAVAVRAGNNSKWYLLRETDSAWLKRQWRDRIIGDVFTELARASRALAGLSSAKNEMHELQGFAVQVGAWLGKDPATVLTETKPLKMPADVKAILDDVDQALGGP